MGLEGAEMMKEHSRAAVFLEPWNRIEDGVSARVYDDRLRGRTAYVVRIRGGQFNTTNRNYLQRTRTDLGRFWALKPRSLPELNLGIKCCNWINLARKAGSCCNKSYLGRECRRLLPITCNTWPFVGALINLTDHPWMPPPSRPKRLK